MNNESAVQVNGIWANALASGPGPVAIIQLSDLKIVFANYLFEHYFGYAHDDILTGGVYFTSLIQEYEHDRFRYQLLSVIDSVSGRSTHSMYSLISKSGTIHSYFLFASPVHNDKENSESLFHLLLMPDNSTWKMPFISHDTRELFLEQFQTEDFGTFEWIIDIDKVFWSSGIYKIYDVEEGFNDLDRNFARSFVHPDDKERLSRATEDAIASNSLLDIEFSIISAKNNVKTINSLARVVTDSEGKPVKFVGSVRDITGMRNIETDLKKKVEELYFSNKELEEFAYVASHDMQEPLRKITTFGSRLLEKYRDILTGDGVMYLTRMTASAENMRVLINDLLEFSRISNTQQPFMKVDLNVALRQVRTDLELIIEETGTEIISSVLPALEAIPSQVRQLFANIIGNAIKFRKEGINCVINIECRELDVKTRLQYNLPLNEAYCALTISDNGIGFEKEYAHRIFNVFQRLHGKSEYPGSGIGLAICKKIAEHHGGLIFAESEPGVGTSFVIILPRKHQ